MIFNIKLGPVDRKIGEFGCPFLKIELLRDNPKNISNLEGWRSVVAQHSEFDCDLI